MSRIVVVGGANTDIFGLPARELVAADSNPGAVRFSFGGVARNVAENLARLGETVELVTVLGDDHASRALSAHCGDVGIGLAHALDVRETPGSIYLAVLDEHGDLEVAVSDMRALEELTPQALEGLLAPVEPPDAVVLDTNVTAEALLYVRERFPEAPFFADGVSVAKVPRILGVLDGMRGLHVNELEARALTGIPVAGEPDGARKAARVLLESGVERVFISGGSRGVHYSSAEDEGRIPAHAFAVRNVTGAGDAFTAGMVWGTLRGMSAAQAARTGIAAASITIASPSTVAPELGAESVLFGAEEVGG